MKLKANFTGTIFLLLSFIRYYFFGQHELPYEIYTISIDSWSHPLGDKMIL